MDNPLWVIEIIENNKNRLFFINRQAFVENLIEIIEIIKISAFHKWTSLCGKPY